jgi:hypothetical protein
MIEHPGRSGPSFQMHWQDGSDRFAATGFGNVGANQA